MLFSVLMGGAFALVLTLNADHLPELVAVMLAAAIR